MANRRSTGKTVRRGRESVQKERGINANGFTGCVRVQRLCRTICMDAGNTPVLGIKNECETIARK